MREAWYLVLCHKRDVVFVDNFVARRRAIENSWKAPRTLLYLPAEYSTLDFDRDASESFRGLVDLLVIESEIFVRVVVSSHKVARLTYREAGSQTRFEFPKCHATVHWLSIDKPVDLFDFEVMVLTAGAIYVPRFRPRETTINGGVVQSHGHADSRLPQRPESMRQRQ